MIPNNIFGSRSYLKNLISGCTLLLFAVSTNATAQTRSPFTGYEKLFITPKSYILYRAETPLKIDGQLNEKAWTDTPWSDDFMDIEGDMKPAPAYNTRVKMLWDEKYLYIASKMAEPHLWANKQSETDIIFRDNVFKIFIDPDNNMNDDFEIQINPDNLMLFLIMNKPYRDGGVPVSGWRPIGLQSAVQLKGTLNNATDRDSGWVAEIAIPLASLNFNPKDTRRNSGFRINFMRTGWDFIVRNGGYSKAVDSAGKALPPHYSVWSPQGLINMHFPERWGYTVFSSAAPSKKDSATFTFPYAERQRNYLWLTYYKQKDWLKKNKRYAGTLQDLGIQEGDVIIDGKKNRLKLEATSKQFLVTITDEDGKTITINQDGYVE